MNKLANTKFPINELIAGRWSPVVYDSERSLTKDEVGALLEAARWAPSSYNEQPWSYVVGYRGDAVFEKLCECLAEGNLWAKDASVLMLSVAKNFFDHKHNPNRHYMHDVGAASSLLCIQAVSMGLAAHQMAGFDVDKARDYFNIGDDYEPGSMIAVGQMGDVESVNDDQLKERDLSDRQRKDFSEMYWSVD